MTVTPGLHLCVCVCRSRQRRSLVEPWAGLWAVCRTESLLIQFTQRNLSRRSTSLILCKILSHIYDCHKSCEGMVHRKWCNIWIKKQHTHCHDGGYSSSLNYRTSPVYFWLLIISRDRPYLQQMFLKFDHVYALVDLRLHLFILNPIHCYSCWNRV